MMHEDDSLQDLAARLGCGDEPQRVREKLEAGLTPLVRRALRYGAGMPPLVRWVRSNLPRVEAGFDRTRPVDPDRAAAPLARLLCATLLRGRADRLADCDTPAGRRAAAETVCGV